MCSEEKRNTAKEKKKRNRKYPYRSRVQQGKIMKNNTEPLKIKTN